MTSGGAELSGDLDLAREVLRGGGCCLVMVKGGEVLWRSDDRMLLGLLGCLDALGPACRGASMADTVVGKAAALVARAAGVGEVYAPLLSQSALAYLRNEGIEAQYDRLVPGILNRSQDDLCPLEQLTRDVDDAGEALELIRGFYARMALGGPPGATGQQSGEA